MKAGLWLSCLRTTWCLSGAIPEPQCRLWRNWVCSLSVGMWEFPQSWSDHRPQCVASTIPVLFPSGKSACTYTLPSRKAGWRPTCLPEGGCCPFNRHWKNQREKDSRRGTMKRKPPKGRARLCPPPLCKASLANIGKPEWGQRTKSLTQSLFFICSKLSFPPAGIYPDFKSLEAGIMNEWTER